MKRQPTWPTYYGPPLPTALNPFNPYHHWLLFTWLFFQPSHLYHYLYQADPLLYREQGLKAMRRTLAQPAYRNLYLTALIFLLALSFGVNYGLAYSLDLPFKLSAWAVGVAGGVAFGVAFGVAVGVAFGVALGVAFGVALSVAFGVAVGVAYGMAFGVVLGVAVGVALSVALSVAFGVAVGVAVGVAFGVAFGVAYGVAFGVTGGVAVGVAVGVLGLMLGDNDLMLIGLFSALGGTASFLRLYVYPFTAIWAVLRGGGHPVSWDELAVWSLPRTLSWVKRCMFDPKGSPFEPFGSNPLLPLTLRPVLANPFQRWAVQRAYSDWLITQPQPVTWLYTLAHDPQCVEYVRPPNRKDEFEDWPTVGQLLLGEIGQTFVEGEAVTKWIWRLTQRLRLTEPTPISRFSLLLYELLRDEEKIDTMPVAELHDYLVARAGLYEGVTDMAHGAEVVQSFRLMTQGVGVGSVGEVVGLEQDNQNKPINPNQNDPDSIRLFQQSRSYLRPTVMESLTALGDVQRELAAYQAATSLGQKNLALNSAASLLKELADYVQAQVLPPEQSLLLRLISHWRDLVTVEQGQLKEQALQQLGPLARQQQASRRQATLWTRPSEPLSNPYIAGTPVYPPLLVGRQDIFNQIASIWQDKAVPDSIILYGHRRMGKTSILRNLDQTVRGLIIYVDLQGEASMVASTAELLLNLGYALRDGAKVAYPLPLTCHNTNEAKIHFDNVLKQITTRPIFLALDEFEMIDQAVSEGKISPDIYRFLRSLGQSPDLTLILGGSHQLAEMSHDYQQAFFKSYQEVTVSFLDRPTAWQLITNPSEDFPLNYEAAAVELIMAVTGGQPYLIQQVCRNALDYLNHQWFDLHQQRDIMILVSDVNAVLGEAILRDGFGYFDGVWKQSSDPLQHQLLRWLATQSTPGGWAEIQAALGFDDVTLRHLLTWAVRHDILLEVAPMQWAYRVPLMREWVLQQMKQG